MDELSTSLCSCFIRCDFAAREVVNSNASRNRWQPRVSYTRAKDTANHGVPLPVRTNLLAFGHHYHLRSKQGPERRFTVNRQYARRGSISTDYPKVIPLCPKSRVFGNDVSSCRQSLKLRVMASLSPHRVTKKWCRSMCNAERPKLIGVPDGIRTHVIAVKEG